MRSALDAVRLLPRTLRRKLLDRLTPSILAEGRPAPEWHLRGHDRAWYRHGPSWSWMVFLPVSRRNPEVVAALGDLGKRHRDLASLGVRIFVVMPAGIETLERIARDLDLPFPLCADEDVAVARRFQVVPRLPFAPRIVPTGYLLNPRGTVRLAQRGIPPAEAVVRTVLALGQATRDGT